MTFLEELTAHKGGLIRVKTELFWYGGRGWDGVHDRICLLMDSALTYDGAPATRTTHDPWATAAARAGVIEAAAIACLLIDGRPHWVRLALADLELL
jgi:hypothetical protein